MKFYLVDVFAERKYQGNQLAVFSWTGSPDGKEPTDGEMQRIAKETNFAETSFILSGKRENGGYDVRIFTPDFEVPFAGHPSLGTAYIIRNELEQEDSDIVLLNLKVGQIPVTFEKDGVLWMKQKAPAFGPRFQPGGVLEVLGVAGTDLDKRFPIQEVSTGLPSIIIPLISLDAIKRCRIDHDRYRRFLKEERDAILLVFTDQTYHGENTLNVRVFANDSGYPEDAATGSANGNLAAYLLEHDYFGKCAISYTVEQGYEMGRPSLLQVAAEKTGGKFELNVGGRVVPVARGEWLP
jgi:trans-2,3-dihydro-3-hydroxyanthranilate isomerase